jgi:hypothetical protein
MCGVVHSHGRLQVAHTNISNPLFGPRLTTCRPRAAATANSGSLHLSTDFKVNMSSGCTCPAERGRGHDVSDHRGDDGSARDHKQRQQGCLGAAVHGRAQHALHTRRLCDEWHAHNVRWQQRFQLDICLQSRCASPVHHSLQRCFDQQSDCQQQPGFDMCRWAS